MGQPQSSLSMALDHSAPADPVKARAERWTGRLLRGVPTRRDRDKPADIRQLAHVRTVAMSFRNMHEYGDLLPRYMEERKSIFIDRLNWHVSEADGMEFDQYDTPACRWIVLLEYGEIIGGVRLLPTTATCGIYSYMLRDAQRGLLDDIPTDVLFIDAPVNDRIWEATRFFVTDSVSSQRRLAVHELLFRAMNRVAREHGAAYILGIVPAIWARWARRLGVSATPIGAPFRIDDARSQSVLFKTRSWQSQDTGRVN